MISLSNLPLDRSCFFIRLFILSCSALYFFFLTARECCLCNGKKTRNMTHKSNIKSSSSSFLDLFAEQIKVSVFCVFISFIFCALKMGKWRGALQLIQWLSFKTFWYLCSEKSLLNEPFFSLNLYDTYGAYAS